MQADIDTIATPIQIRISGINLIGAEDGNEANCAGRSIPWLQDTIQEKVWDDWNVTWRDVVILDTLNVPVAVFNLTEHDLSVQAEYDSLKSLLLEAAGR